MESSSGKRKMDSANPDEGPSSKIPRPETPVSKACAFLTSMIQKEVNSQLNLGDPLFPDVSEDDLKSFEDVTKECDENPGKDILQELVKQIKVRVDIVRQKVKTHMLTKYTQMDEKFTAAFNNMGGCLQTALDILDKVNEPFEDMKCIGVTMQNMYENYVVTEESRDLWLQCLKDLHDVAKNAASKLGNALKAKAQAKKEELNRKMTYIALKHVEFFTKNSAFPKTTNGTSAAIAALQSFHQCSPEEVKCHAQRIMKTLDEERDKVLLHIDNIFMDILTTCVETMGNEYKVTSDASMMTMYGAISLLTEFCRVLSCYILEESSVMIARQPQITKEDLVSTMTRRIQEICMRVFAQYLLGCDPLRVCSPSVEDLRAIAEESDEDEAIAAHVRATAVSSPISPPDSPVPSESDIPLGTVTVAETSDEEADEGEESQAEVEEETQEEEGEADDSVSVKSEPESEGEVHHAELVEVKDEDTDSGEEVEEEQQPASGKRTHPMVTRSKADQ
ncbi:regulatory protein IE1 [Panine betaherpesvirus 2]|uniref:Regulatory protein IE1 n=1 Tax=Panine betaherpesvirus 2 TaxID=188763 RepID=Q8QRY6_9BETA|nr:regulatory protein IE1 [Panine betaherpesvirus 2]AAM00752.1 regulatory protein IE1 [Panine betaherpesvirus 2]QXV67866.1 regulatory protein IE1 [Panine betaherpesvirus 2]